ncbi:6-hydroxymethylpterin diphosphokinase MptE-like protein [uncultured Pseudodesulfovibrio sp.]|uniref:6-hydroxymethylpterin diphosphokinase MptE-like protein n=1 Tax=uncultured Pseudodesulfovibrio sp. TaxID=2035858 RepID=UPI0029C64088|nr:6-hydroxymethylpterin diphosphokinase MptE-like protein [uncultured Pseudodesulfovibrio sp.]
MENSKIAALVELGILCRGEPVEVCGDGSLDVGPHRYSAHDQLCQYENPSCRHPFEDSSIPAFEYYSPDLTIEGALARTRLVILIGVADSEALKLCLANPNLILIIFEPDERVLIRFLESVRLSRLNRKNIFCFTGDPYSLNPALQDLLPGEMFKAGTPAFFMTDRIREGYGPWAKDVIEYLEILHYRHVIYPLSGQTLARSRPFRNIHRGMLCDQQLHAYENIPDWLTFPSIAGLKNRFSGGSAILVAAGPELPEKFEYIRRNMGQVVIICVNNAIKPLAEAGIHPHFVVINDTSITSGHVFKHIPKMAETILVGHCLSDLGGDRFKQKYLFGSFLPELFGEREMLRLHGSVISTAFALARHLGCGQCAFVGAQLASDNPWGLGYAKGTVGKDVLEQQRPLIHKHPQLYPKTSPFGEQLYTTLNFRDAALWLGEVIRLSGMDCVNTSKSSILFGREIRYEAEPDFSGTPVKRIMADLFRTEPPRVDRAGVKRYLNHELALWASVRDAAKAILSEEGPTLTAKGMAVLSQLDKSNVTYLLERYEGYINGIFYLKVFKGDESTREEGMRYFYTHLCRMCDEFLAKLNVAVRSL